MLMRFTIVDSDGAISFRGPGHAMKMLTAAASSGAAGHRELLDELNSLDDQLAESIVRGLSIFDEHCLKEEPETIANRMAEYHEFAGEPFRVFDHATRQLSLDPERLGLVIFNLGERRIVQVQNSYGSLLRCDRGRIRNQGRPTGRFYRYELPDSWSIVP
jgi:hypothetical protein